MMRESKFKKHFATALFFFFILFILLTVYTFINGFFGALLLYIMLFPFHNFMIKKKVNKTVSAWIVVFLAIFIIIIPLLLVLGIIGNEVYQVLKNPEVISSVSTTISNTITEIIPMFSREAFDEQLKNIASTIGSIIVGTFSNIGNFVINLFIALFMLYYMLKQDNLFHKIREVLPFNRHNSRELVEKLKAISYSTVFVGGIIALVQGGLLTIAFLIFGIKGAFLWGFITAILSFLPIVGPTLVWIPAALIQFFGGNHGVAIGITIAGLFISNIDNFLRPILGLRIGKIHPIETFIGLFIGIYLFGIIGVFIGPLLLATSVLVFKMFKEEYIN